MPRKQSPAFHFTVYILARCAICLFQMVSDRVANVLVDALAWIAFAVDKRHRLVALENLRQAFPGGYRESELNKLVLATYRHFFTLMVEICRLPRKMHRHNARH
jgi:lauroyl/myristoyl acyltransferase